MFRSWGSIYQLCDGCGISSLIDDLDRGYCFPCIIKGVNFCVRCREPHKLLSSEVCSSCSPKNPIQQLPKKEEIVQEFCEFCDLPEISCICEFECSNCEIEVYRYASVCHGCYSRFQKVVGE